MTLESIIIELLRFVAYASVGATIAAVLIACAQVAGDADDAQEWNE